ncbi:MAG: hypothetical protein RR274_02720, partial [Erysipelotrichaceae bacterium]
VIIDDGKSVFKDTVASESLKQLKNEYGGNGKFVSIEDVTKDYSIDTRKLFDVLHVANYKYGEIRLICELVEKHQHYKK